MPSRLKQYLDQQDKSFLETRWHGKLELIPDDELAALVEDSLRTLKMKTVDGVVVSGEVELLPQVTAPHRETVSADRSDEGESTEEADERRWFEEDGSATDSEGGDG